MTIDYKKYSLDKLKEWVHDALSSGEASPHEIYSVIREAAQEDYQFYKDHSARAFGLLELMSGHRPIADKPVLKCDKDDPSPECKGAWNDFWEENYYPEEHSKHYYDYTRNDPDKPNPFKPKKWELPVEADGSSGEYLVTFPDDLLEAADLKEGDTIEWVDQGDGSYLLKKVEKKTLNYKEAIEAGWEMTGDGFWMPPDKK